MPHKRIRFAVFPLLAVLVAVLLLPAKAADLPSTEEVKADLQGKSILFLGDSYTSTRGLDDYWDSWSGRLQTDYGMEVNCHSYNGSTITLAPFVGFAPGCCWWPICLRQIPEEPYDFIFVTCGSNDWDNDLPIGTDLESRSPWFFTSAINLLIDRIQEKHPESILIFMTPWVSTGSQNLHGYTTNDYAFAMERVCRLRGVYCLNVSFPWISGIFADNYDFRQEYFISSSDYWHLNEKGHERFLPLAALWLDMIDQYESQRKHKLHPLHPRKHGTWGTIVPEIQ